MYIVKGLFTEQECKDIIPTWTKEKINSLYGEGNTRVHKNNVQVSTNYYGFNAVMEQMFKERTLSELEDSNLFCRSGVMITKYQEGDFVGIHDDSTTDPSRKYTTVTMLQDCEEGGKLVVLGKEIDLEVGDMIVYDPTLLHEVTTVIKGERYTLMTWWH